MGCGNCGTGASGTPSGCKSNGGCSTGGCNRLNVYDWLNALPLHDGAKPYPVIEVSFNKGSRKDFYKNNTSYILDKNDWIAVEGVGGYDVGQVSLTGELVKLQLKKYGVKELEVNKRVLHPATEEEMQQWAKQKEREAEMMIRARAIARSLNLDMKLCEVEIQADSKKGTFFYTADQRVDFRELIKLFAGDFKMKVEMRQIGARQESGKVGGIGSCGRELCCSTWLTDFKSVNTTAARYQNLSINQTKLSGQCGRLKCCLNYELDTYMDALSVFPDHADHLETVKGMAHLQKRDIFKNLMWYSYSDNNKQYPLTITRVKEIQKLNKAGQKADELHPIELETKESKAGVKADVGFINDIGQITLKTLEKNNNKKKKKPGGGNKEPQIVAEGAQQEGNKSPNGAGNKPKGNRPQGSQGGKPSQQAAPGNTPKGSTQQSTPPKGSNSNQQAGNNTPKGNRGPKPSGNQQQQPNRGQQNAANNPPVEDKVSSPSTNAQPQVSKPQGPRPQNGPNNADRPPRNPNQPRPNQQPRRNRPQTEPGQPEKTNTEPPATDN